MGGKQNSVSLGDLEGRILDIANWEGKTLSEMIKVFCQEGVDKRRPLYNFKNGKLTKVKKGKK